MNKNKKKYIEPEIRETVLECEDIITTSGNSLSTRTTGASNDFVSVGTASWSNIYNSANE